MSWFTQYWPAWLFAVELIAAFLLGCWMDYKDASR